MSNSFGLYLLTLNQCGKASKSIIPILTSIVDPAIEFISKRKKHAPFNARAFVKIKDKTYYLTGLTATPT